MRKHTAVCLLLVTLAVTFAGCASQGAADSGNERASIQIIQTSGVPSAARHVEGVLQVEFALRLTNRTAEQVKLKRITLQSQSQGAYHISHSMPYDVTIPAGAAEDVTFRGPAQTGQSLVGVNGPVTLRVTAEFEGSAGKFREIATRVVNADASITGEKE